MAKKVGDTVKLKSGGFFSHAEIVFRNQILFFFCSGQKGTKIVNLVLIGQKTHYSLELVLGCDEWVKYKDMNNDRITLSIGKSDEKVLIASFFVDSWAFSLFTVARLSKFEGLLFTMFMVSIQS